MFNFNGKLVLTISTLLLSQAVLAKGEWNAFRSATPEALFGGAGDNSVIARNQLYVLRSTKMNKDIKTLIGKCQIDSSVERAQFESMALTQGVTMSSVYSLQTGKLLTVIAKGKVVQQGKPQEKIMALYSDDCSIDSFTKSFFGYRETAYEDGYGSTRTPRLDPAAPTEYPQSCNIVAQAQDEYSDSVSVSVSCSKRAKARVMVTSKNRFLCDEYAYVGPDYTTICKVERDPTLPANLHIEVMSQGRSFYTNEHFAKAPTFDYPVQASYVDAKNYMMADAEKESVPWRGTSYKAEIKVNVIDNDINSKDPQNEIRVIVKNLTTKKIVSQRYLSTNQTTTFLLTGFYEVPRMFGNPHWHTDKALQPGINELVVEAYDAYNYQDKNPVVLEKIVIEVPVANK